MGKLNGVGKREIASSGDRSGTRLLQGVERRMKSTRPIPSEKQRRIDRILKEMNTTSERMDRLLKVFNRINGGL